MEVVGLTGINGNLIYFAPSSIAAITAHKDDASVHYQGKLDPVVDGSNIWMVGMPDEFVVRENPVLILQLIAGVCDEDIRVASQTANGSALAIYHPSYNEDANAPTKKVDSTDFDEAKFRDFLNG